MTEERSKGVDKKSKFRHPITVFVMYLLPLIPVGGTLYYIGYNQERNPTKEYLKYVCSYESVGGYLSAVSPRKQRELCTKEVMEELLFTEKEGPKNSGYAGLATEKSLSKLETSIQKQQRSDEEHAFLMSKYEKVGEKLDSVRWSYLSELHKIQGVLELACRKGPYYNQKLCNQKIKDFSTATTSFVEKDRELVGEVYLLNRAMLGVKLENIF